MRYDYGRLTTGSPLEVVAEGRHQHLRAIDSVTEELRLATNEVERIRAVLARALEGLAEFDRWILDNKIELPPLVPRPENST